MTPLRQSLADWFPVVMTYAGILGVASQAYNFWAHGRVDTGLLIMFGAMMGLSEIAHAVQPLSFSKPAAPPAEQPMLPPVKEKP